MRDSTDDSVIPPAALWLGLGGLIPFLACLAAIWLGWRHPLVGPPAPIILGYAAVILSFLGGVRWGIALRMVDRSLQTEALIVSVLPSLAAWLALLAPPPAALIAMAALFLLLGIADTRLPDVGAPDWYRRLRILLTAIVAPALLLAAAGLARGG
jgi:hypothetical protein